MRLIDADALLEKMKSTPRYFDVKFDVEEMPTITESEIRAKGIEKFVDKLIEKLQVQAGKADDNCARGEGNLSNYWDGFGDGLLETVRSVRNMVKEFAKDTNVLGNGWIPCSEQMPDEHESIFAQFKGTDRWRNGMFERCSNTVNVTVVAKNGSRTTVPAITADGIWSCDLLRADSTCRVIAWTPLPEPYKEEKKEE